MMRTWRDTAAADMSADIPRAAFLNWFGLVFIGGQNTQILEVGKVLTKVLTNFSSFRVLDSRGASQSELKLTSTFPYVKKLDSPHSAPL